MKIIGELGPLCGIVAFGGVYFKETEMETDKQKPSTRPNPRLPISLELMRSMKIVGKWNRSAWDNMLWAALLNMLFRIPQVRRSDCVFTA